MKTKLTNERLKELRRRQEKLRKIVLSSPYGTTIRGQELTEEEVEVIANLLSGMCLEESVIADLTRIPNPTEDQIAQRVAFNLQRQADLLGAFGESLTALSRIKSDAVLALKVDCPTD
jgi:hypothetical protein